MEQRASQQNLGEHFPTLKKILVFFVDSMIAESNFSISDEWNQKRLAYELDSEDHAGDDKFYVLLEQTLNEHTPAAEDLLTVFYTCLVLGFQGNAPENRDRIIQKISDRIQNWFRKGNAKSASKDDYQVNTKDYRKRPTPIFIVTLIVLVGLSVLLAVSNNLTFKSHTKNLQESLARIITWRN